MIERQTYERLNVIEERTKPPPEEDNQDQIAGTYSQLQGFNNGMLMIEQQGMAGMPPPPQQQQQQLGMQGGIDMSGFASAGPPGGMPAGMMPNGGMPNGGMPNGMGNPGQMGMMPPGGM